MLNHLDGPIRVSTGLGQVVNIATSADLVESMPRLMNAVFAQDDIACPFNSFEDSLLQFARAIYALKLDGGRCIQPGLPAGCGFYDPNQLYAAPQVSTISYSAESITYTGDEGAGKAGIGSSFGMDFIEVVLEPAAYDSVALIISRIDAHETQDSVGAYTITLNTG